MIRNLLCLSLFVVTVGCPTLSETVQEHPCELAVDCIYDATLGESNCREGYTWEDPTDANNYN